jgi:hypothetical protein
MTIIVAVILYLIVMLSAACVGIVAWTMLVAWWIPEQFAVTTAIVFATAHVIAVHVRFVRRSDVETIFKS